MWFCVRLCVSWQAVRLPWLVSELFSLNQLGPPASLQSSQWRPHGLTPTLKGAIQPHTARDTHTHIKNVHRSAGREIFKATPTHSNLTCSAGLSINTIYNWTSHITPWFHWARLYNVTCATWLCSSLHVASALAGVFQMQSGIEGKSMVSRWKYFVSKH